MKERPIIFSGESVRAILEDRKTQTRRVVKLPQWSTGDWSDFELWSDTTAVAISRETGCAAEVKCPYGQPGDRLWVKETWAIDEDDGPVIFYKAIDHPSCGQPWKSPRFMPRWASRLLLEIVSVRVERVQQITRDDAIAEGITSWVDGRIILKDPPPGLATESFCVIWDSKNAKRGFGWDKNPWVWVIEFRRLDS